MGIGLRRGISPDKEETADTAKTGGPRNTAKPRSTSGTAGTSQDPSRWRSRPVLSRVVAIAVPSAPFVVALVLALLVEMLVPEPSVAFARVAWWVGVVGLPLAVLHATRQQARRFRPLAPLLGMELAFPGVAPSRPRVALHATRAADMARMVDELRSRGRQKRPAGDPASVAERMITLAAYLGTYDRRMRAHAERVTAITDLVAAKLGVTGRDRDRLRWTAVLHDVGKLAVHREVLTSQNRLMAVERDLVKRHPVEGSRLAAPMSDWLGVWGSGIAEHHERHDGCGYPLGLEGDSISLAGRILAVADAFDAMTSVRSYRKPIPTDAARSEMARLSGSKFDPEVVRAFLAVPKRRLDLLARAPLLGSLPFSLGSISDSLQLERLGRSAATLLLVCAVVGLTTLAPAGRARPGSVGAGVSPGQRADPPGPSGGDPPSSDPATSGAAGSTDPGGGSGGSGTAGGGSGSSGANGPDRVSVAGDLRTGTLRHLGHEAVPGSGRGVSELSTGTPAGDDPPGSSPPGSSPPSTGGGTTPGTSGGSPPSTSGGKPPATTSGGKPPPTTSKGKPPPTTSGKPPPTTTGKPPPTTEKQPPPPPTTHPAPSPPTGVDAAAACQNVVLGPYVTLTWTDSSSSSVSGYEILRSTNGTSFSDLASVSAGAKTYTDSSVLGLGTTYWYEVRALSPYGSATSGAVSATTPLTCL